jgi:hypothetical protein
MNAAVLPVIRRHHPTRIVFLGGLHYMNSAWILANPDAVHMLPVPTPTDDHLALEVHSYARHHITMSHPDATHPSSMT